MEANQPSSVHHLALLGLMPNCTGGALQSGLPVQLGIKHFKITAILAPREKMKAIMSAGTHNMWETGPCGERLNIEISGH